VLSLVNRDRSNTLIYHLYRTSHPGGDDAARIYADLADALHASGVPAACWNAVVSTHPDEIATFFSVPGFIPAGDGPQWTIHGPGVAAEFCAGQRLAGGLPALKGGDL
jgi:hypothetical protein